MLRCRSLLAVLLATCACSSPWTLANAQANSPDPLYATLGERTGIEKLAVDFVARVRVDPRIGHFFKDTNPKFLAEQLRDQFCEVSGGPCKRDGPNMRLAHESMEIGKADFNALVEVLQQSMDAQRIPFSGQNQLLARLAPMHREIINKP